MAGPRPGSGLGLYMAKAVVEVHGGTLTLCNAGTDGAKFRIWLPVRDVQGKDVASTERSSDNSSNNYQLALDTKNVHG
jgi:K+-sensing histidine kinase KdpD